MLNDLVNSLNDLGLIPLMMMIASLTPEILIACTAFLLLLGGALSTSKSIKSVIHGVGFFVIVCEIGIMLIFPNHGRYSLFSNMLVIDDFSQFVKLLLLLSTAFVFMISAYWIEEACFGFEFVILILFSLLGMMLLVSANNFMSLYVSLELSSLPLYVLAAFKRDSLKSTEAGLKYVVLGALASGILLFGITLIYGFSGTLQFVDLHNLFVSSHTASSGIIVGLVLVLVGIFFKISAAPFHMWTPDVYEGAPTPITAFFSTTPKFAALALLMRLLIQPFGALPDWQPIIEFVSVLSMLVGALGAITQTNIKRLLAYGSIGNVGYILTGVAMNSSDGIASSLIYMAIYISMSAGMFTCIMMMKRAGDPVELISDLNGLSRRQPFMAAAIAIFMFSMAGIPPLAGFFGKFYVFLAATHAGFEKLAFIGVITSVIACFYYLKVVKVMYFDEPVALLDQRQYPVYKILLTFALGIALFFFLFPVYLIEESQIAAGALFQ